MPRPNEGRFVLKDLTGGRNGYDPPMDIPDNQVAEAMNWDYSRGGGLGSSRQGASIVSMSSGPSDNVDGLGRFVPGTTEAAAELWAFDSADIYRIAGGSAWAGITEIDTPAAANGVSTATFNGKFYIAINNAENRLHLWDQTSYRRVGIVASAAATVADQGVGTYAQVLRYYKIKFFIISGSTIIAQSELSASVSHTPGVNVLSARVTKPTTVDSATHWMVYGSADDAEYFEVSGQIAVGTTTYDDTATVANYSAGTAAPIVGLYIPPPSAKYVVRDGPRVVMAGCHETSGSSGQTSPKNNRVWWTLPLGTANAGEDEAIPNTEDPVFGKQFTDLGENDGSGEITGLSPPINGVIFAFTRRQTWALRPTKDVTVPYLSYLLSDSVGCVAHQSIVAAEDEQGNPAIYFWSTRGPYRIAQGRLQYCGLDIEDRITEATNSDNLHKTFALYHADQRQVWFCVRTVLSGISTFPSELLIFNVPLGRAVGTGDVRGGWARYSFDTTSTAVEDQYACGVMFANTLGASMSVDLKPYLGGNAFTGGAAIVSKYDADGIDYDRNDQSTSGYTARLTTKVYNPTDLTQKFTVASPLLIGEAGSGSITVTATPNFGAQSDVSGTAVSLAAAGSETHVIKRVSDLQASGLDAVQFTVSGFPQTSALFTLDALIVPWQAQEAL